MSDETPETRLARGPSEEPWRGDEHRLQVSAAAEAGLAHKDVSLDLYRQGFRRGLRVRDPLDAALVLRGRTVLREEQLAPAIRRIFTHLHLGASTYSLRVDDGEFEVRIAASAADGGSASLEAMRRALLVFVVGGLGGLLLLKSSSAFALLLWSAGLLAGAAILRRGVAEGRTRLAARLVDELAQLAEREQLILPPAGGEGG
ncbi:MAG: hypothetical protein KC420_14225 [Myxococcales bacterium]|nr:hypothetical protein [Myxococcales bacterium]MCB9570009.1 hypothetical protein [Myxococcales bacterium]MCB9703312.1 hypothetical protein [Myxococcales bacterium]